MYLERLFCLPYKKAARTEFSDVTAPYLYNTAKSSLPAQDD